MASKSREERTAKKLGKKMKKQKSMMIAVFLISILLTGFFILIDQSPEIVDVEGEKWAVLVAGSWGYIFYRHQADIAHDYQILKRNGYDDSHIIVFMCDNIANHGNNPRLGTVVNNDKLVDYYKGVPKDYVHEHATAENLIAVLLGDKTKIDGGSGKLVRGGPNDRIFFFYSGHGNNLGLQMPSPQGQGFIFKENLAIALKELHARNGYMSMIIYINACLDGDIGTYITPDLRIYVLTCGALQEECDSAYCSKAKKLQPPYSPEEYNICLASEFGSKWMEHCEEVDTTEVTFQEQFETVKKRMVYSNVTQHGDLNLATEKLSVYLGPSKSVRRKD